MDDEGRAQLSGDNTVAFILAGNAIFTLVNSETGNRFTFRVRRPKKDAPHFVSVLTGPDTDNDFQFLGTIFEGKTYVHGRKSGIGKDAQSARVAAWAFPRIFEGTLPESIQVWHEGRCGKCGRRLTVPESIMIGLGPTCASKGL